MPSPLIGVTACIKPVQDERHTYHAAAEPYILAVAGGAGAVPVLVPALGEALDCDALLARLDGLLFTGSRSNLEQWRYGLTEDAPTPPYDPRRDATTLPLLRRALALGVPVLGICRGFQELNVALGGTLHPRVHEVAGCNDHRSNPDRDLDAQFGPAHPVRLVAGGVLAGLAGGVATAMVNSLHGQGIARLAPGLVVEAVAEDGLVEAVRVEQAAAFAMAVQWHPEWNWREDALSAALLRAFGAAARQRAARGQNVEPQI